MSNPAAPTTPSTHITPGGRRITAVVRDRIVERGLATRPDLWRLADAWLRWSASDDGWFLIPHGEVLCGVPSP